MSRFTLNLNPPYGMFVFVLLAVVLVSACTSTESATSEPTLEPTVAEVVTTSRPPVGLDPTATVPPPSYREPVAPITLENASQIDYLGRLDTQGRKSTIFNWAMSPDGTQLVGINNDLLMEWNLVTGRLNFNTGRRNITEVFYTADKSEVYAIEPDGRTYIYRSITGDELTSIRLHDSYSGVMTYNEFNGWLAVAGTDGSIKVWDLAERVSLVTFDAHDEGIVALTFSSDGTRLASTAVDGTVKLWDWQAKSQLAEYDLQNAIALDMTFSPDDSQLAISTNNFVAVWDVTTDELGFVLQSGSDTANEILAYSPDGHFLVTAGEQGNMRLWNAETSNLEIELPDIGGIRVGAAFAPDSTLLATTLLARDASLWNLTNITEKGVGRAPLNIESNNLFGVDWSSDGYTLLFFDASGEIYVWGIPTDSE
jgi:WD40 repeat protein